MQQTHCNICGREMDKDVRNVCGSVLKFEAKPDINLLINAIDSDGDDDDDMDVCKDCLSGAFKDNAAYLVDFREVVKDDEEEEEDDGDDDDD